MPTAIDPTWGVPVICLAIAAIGVTWAKLTTIARDRRRHARSTKAPPPQASPSLPR